MNAGYNAATLQSDDWRTPEWLFRALDIEFGFTFDAAADAGNAKCGAFCADIDALTEEMIGDEDVVFCNPPYSKIDAFIAAASTYGKRWVLILPVRTRARWFHHLAASDHVEFRWLRKRIAFDPPPTIKASNPRMDTFIAVVR